MTEEERRRWVDKNKYCILGILNEATVKRREGEMAVRTAEKFHDLVVEEMNRWLKELSPPTSSPSSVSRGPNGTSINSQPTKAAAQR